MDPNQLIVPGILLVLIIGVLKSGIKFVPQNRAYLVERFGKFHSTKEAGLNFIIPFIDRVAADRSLKEQAVDIPSQGGITKDNISLTVDGVLYFRVLDPYKATYGVDDYIFAVTQLAQTTMRSELGKMELDKTFEERDQLNANIVNSINQASQPWGIQVMRYEIKDIVPPASIMDAMEAQMKAERVKRAQILESEGDRQAAINVAEGQKQAVVLAAEADKSEAVLRAEGEAKAIIAVAEAQAKHCVLWVKLLTLSMGRKLFNWIWLPRRSKPNRPSRASHRSYCFRITAQMQPALWPKAWRSSIK